MILIWRIGVREIKLVVLFVVVVEELFIARCVVFRISFCEIRRFIRGKIGFAIGVC